MQVRHRAGEQAVDSRAESVAGARVHGQLVACASDVVDLCTSFGTVGCAMRAVGVLYDEIPVRYADR